MFPDSPIPHVIRTPRFRTAYFSSGSMARSIAGRRRSAFTCCGSPFLNPSLLPGARLSAVSTAPRRRCGSWVGSCGISSMTPELLSQDEVDERALRGLVGVVKISHTVVNGISLVNFDGFAPASQWEELATAIPVLPAAKGNGTGKERASR